MSETLIAPSVLAADFGALRSEMQDVESAGADLLHIDVMDGSFVPPITFGDTMVAVAKGAVNIPIEAHLMIKQPARHLDAYARAGADRIIIHYETCPHLHKDLADIKKLGCSNGVALNPATPINVVEDILEDCDLVLIMTVNPGWGGQKFIDMTLCKIEQLKARITQRGLPTLVLSLIHI